LAHFRERKLKRNMNAYLLFAKEVKMAMLRENPSALQDDIDKMVHHKWRHVLSSEEKRPYFDKAEKLRRDAANKQQRKRERARAAAAAEEAVAASPTTSEPPCMRESTTDSECGSSRSAPASPDSGCPSTPEGRDSSSTTSSPIPEKRNKDKPMAKSGASAMHARHVNRARITVVPPANLMSPYIAAATARGVPVGYGAQHIAYHPMVPPLIHPAYPVSYMHPFFMPPSMLPPHVHSYHPGYGMPHAHPAYPLPAGRDMHFYTNYVGKQMASPQPYCGMPMFAPQQMRHPPPPCHSTPCPGADASTPITSSAGAPPIQDLGGGDADRICRLSIRDEDEEERSKDSANDDSYFPPGEN